MTEPEPHERIEPTLEPDPLSIPLRHAPEKKKKAPRKFSLIASLFWTVFIVLGLGFLAVVGLRWVPPPVTSFMLQSPTKPVRYQWVPATQIADVARKAVVAAEDQKFYTHQGFDIEAIEKAYEHNQKSKRKRGASTISQQVAKNLFLWPGGGYFRKGLEAGATTLIEFFWTKERILEVYLNVAEFGKGIYGVEAASQIYFHKPAAQLSAQQAAQLAAVLPSPRRYSAQNPGPYVQRRAGWILRQMGYGGAAPSDEPEPELPYHPEDEEMPALDSSEFPSDGGEEPLPEGEPLEPVNPEEAAPPAEEGAVPEEAPAETPVEVPAAEEPPPPAEVPPAH